MPSNIENQARSNFGQVVDMAGDAADKVTTAAAELGNAAMETGKTVADAATDTYRRGARAVRYVGRGTAEEPMLALAIAGIIGYLIARILHR